MTIPTSPSRGSSFIAGALSVHFPAGPSAPLSPGALPSVETSASSSTSHGGSLCWWLFAAAVPSAFAAPEKKAPVDATDERRLAALEALLRHERRMADYARARYVTAMRASIVPATGAVTQHHPAAAP